MVIILDRETQFTSNFWQGLFNLERIEINRTISAHRPQAEG